MSVGAPGAQGSAKHSTAAKGARASRAVVVPAIQVWERGRECLVRERQVLVAGAMSPVQGTGGGAGKSRGGLRGPLAWTASWAIGKLHFQERWAGQV